jgi:hypothetical protein
MNLTLSRFEPTGFRRLVSNLTTALRLLWVVLAVMPVMLQAQVAGSITVYPANASCEIGASLQCTAYVPISPNTVIWSINDIPGGNATFGTVSATGFYQAPAVAPAANVVTVKAQSTAFPKSFGTISLTITRKYPWLWSVYPAKLSTGNYSVSFNGANFAPDSQVLINGVAVNSVYVSPTQINVSGNAPQAGTLVFSVLQPGNGSVTGNTVSVKVTVPVVTVTVAPASANVPLTTTKAFSASVVGTANTAVSWSVNGIAGGSAAVGTISAAGVYTAPAVMPASPTVTIQATSNANPASSGQATVTLAPAPPPVTVTVSPTAASIQLAASQSFTATVTGSANTAVTWSVNGINGGSASLGTVNGSGIFRGQFETRKHPGVCRHGHRRRQHRGHLVGEWSRRRFRRGGHHFSGRPLHPARVPAC